MSRYIDADKALEVWKDQDYIKLSSQETKARIMLDAVPTADVVEVVRCKDCNNADYAGCPKGRCYCMEHGTYFSSNDYCSYGEREDGDEE